jgi:putative oxidoreductase
MFNKYFSKYHDTAYVIFRIVIGLLFFVHGTQKFLGWFDAKAAAPFMSIFWIAGVIETIVGPLIALGLFTRLAALIGACDMIGAYLIGHIGLFSSRLHSVLPYQNGGELALLYLVSFFIIIIYGAQKASLDKAIFGKEIF